MFSLKQFISRRGAENAEEEKRRKNIFMDLVLKICGLLALPKKNAQSHSVRQEEFAEEEDKKQFFSATSAPPRLCERQDTWNL